MSDLPQSGPSAPPPRSSSPAGWAGESLPPPWATPSTSPPWAARLALLRSAVTPGRVVLGAAGTVAAVVFAVVFLRTPSHPAELVLPKAGDSPPAAGTVAGATSGSPGGGSGGGGSGGGVAGATLGSAGGAAAGPATSVGGGVGVVTAHAAGQVKVPGVYSVPAGARVTDLVTAAG
ncbi:MAG: hypothetical protein QOI56_966, partial [Actinomycetota bacterium]|nr:hypothetical protein [Actinomycetota bacterium]